jgi:hypothetical protein
MDERIRSLTPGQAQQALNRDGSFGGKKETSRNGRLECWSFLHLPGVGTQKCKLLARPLSSRSACGCRIHTSE